MPTPYWHSKKLHGQFVNEKAENDWNKYWQSIIKGDLKGFTIDLPECWMCLEKGETVNHTISERSKLAQREY